MFEEAKNNPVLKPADDLTPEEKAKEAAKKLMEKLAKAEGVMPLTEPITGRDKTLTELRYDFSKISGWEYVEAMDMDKSATNAFKMTNKQALCLFAAAVSKVMDEVDATDVRTRLGMMDSRNAVSITVSFLAASAQVGKKNSSGE